MSNTRISKAHATALLAAEGLNWNSPAIDICDVLAMEGYSEGAIEGAMLWLGDGPAPIQNGR